MPPKLVAAVVIVVMLASIGAPVYASSDEVSIDYVLDEMMQEAQNHDYRRIWSCGSRVPYSLGAHASENSGAYSHCRDFDWQYYFCSRHDFS